jgi:hypothetical protein
MKSSRSKLAILTAAIFVAGSMANFWGCSETSPLQPAAATPATDVLQKGKPAKATYPQEGSVTLSYVDGSSGGSSFTGGDEGFKDGEAGYTGGTINIANGSKLQISPNSLTAPPALAGQPITITMRVEKDEVTNTLFYEFGPSGCEFAPSAEVEFHFSDLQGNTNDVKLFYIDANGDYIEELPDNVDVRGKKFVLSIDHFSRYAIGAE